MNDTDNQGIDRIVVFELSDQRYALPVVAVQEIQQIVRPTELPATSPALLGMVDLRGHVLPLIDLRILLGTEAQEISLQTPMIIGVTGAQRVALVVDQVDDVIDLPPSCVQAPSPIYEIADRMLGVCRVGEGLVFILDIGRLVPEEQVAEVKRLVEGGV